MQVLKDGDKIVCTRGCEPFTVGEVYEIGSVIAKSFSILAKGREYFGVIDEEGIKVSTTNFLIYFEFYVPNEELYQDSEGTILATKNGDPVGLIKTPTWTWTHTRSALVHVMLLGGCKYIMCEVADEDRDFEWIDSLDIVIITHTTIEDETCSIKFIDIDGEEHAAAQPVNLDGSIMSYGQYLKMKN